LGVYLFLSDKLAARPRAPRGRGAAETQQHKAHKTNETLAGGCLEAVASPPRPPSGTRCAHAMCSLIENFRKTLCTRIPHDEQTCTPATHHVPFSDKLCGEYERLSVARLARHPEAGRRSAYLHAANSLRSAPLVVPPHNASLRGLPARPSG